ncbi:hypothetical protein SEA_JADA_254 [Streptomyces phage Jada]|nr:hypothetical protein SEA_JADA_254 [Streptomyces phage Jada]
MPTGDSGKSDIRVHFSTDQGKHYQIGTIWYKGGRSPAKRGEPDMSDSGRSPLTMVIKNATKISEFPFTMVQNFATKFLIF